MSKVASIDIHTFEASYNIIGKYTEAWAPKTRETADHSLPYTIATAWREGRLTSDAYAQARLADAAPPGP